MRQPAQSADAAGTREPGRRSDVMRRTRKPPVSKRRLRCFRRFLEEDEIEEIAITGSHEENASVAK
jgi:hypothetical protein